MSIAAAREEWNAFLNELDDRRFELHCSDSNAWYRGHSSEKWLLYPSLIRSYVVPKAAPRISHPEVVSPTDGAKERDQKLRDNGLRQRLLNSLKPRAPSTLNLFGKQLESVRGIIGKLDEAEAKYSERRAESRRINRLQKQVRDLEQIWMPFEEALATCVDHSIPTIPMNALNVGAALKTVDLATLNRVGRERAKLESEAHDQVKFYSNTLQNALYVVPGEREAFVDFNFRWRNQLGSSWEVLARMQHYGVFTRLLDWTESPAIGIWFALKHFVEHYQKLRRDEKGKPTSEILDRMLDGVSDFDVPCLWVMNPYALARQATGKDRIMDLTLETGIDYFEQFHKGIWPFQKPIPIYSPWRDDRIASQHGMFTVQGRTLTDLETQTTLTSQQRGSPKGSTPKKTNPVVRKILIGRCAAVFGAHQMASMLPLDRFSLFRDMDSFAATVNARFLD